MSLLAPWFLAGFAALVPLVLLHLRRHRRSADVASLLLWRDLPGTGVSRRSTRIVLPLALALQALLLILAVIALAAPQTGGGPSRAGAAPFVAVVDVSTRMAMTDVSPDRLRSARDGLDRRLAALPDDTPVSVVAAGATPRLVVSRVSPAAARDALSGLRADAPRTDLAAALALAGGELHRAGGTVAVVRAEGDSAPTVRTTDVRTTDTMVGEQADNQALEPPVARCAQDACSVLARVRNEAPQGVRVRLTVIRDGQPAGTRDLTIAAGGGADAVVAAPPGARLELRLERADALADDNRATITVPDPSAPLAVTLVSADATSPLARGLDALPGVTVRRVAPADFSDAGGAGLVILDRVAPSTDLLAGDTPLLLVAPPSLPGGRVGAALADPTPTGSVSGAPLLDGVDLSGLVVSTGGARRIALPDELSAIAWAADGPLLAGGAHTTLLAIDPARSNLAQLPAFPLLLANVAGAARGQLPTPVAPPAPDSVTLRPTGAPTPDQPTDLWPWLTAAALLVLIAEAATLRPRRPVAA